MFRATSANIYNSSPVSELPDTAGLYKMYSAKKLGSFVEDGQTVFRVFAPRAVKVTLCTFHTPEDLKAEEYPMAKEPDGVWEFSLWGEKYGLFYGFKIWKEGEDTSSADKVICLDPYAKAVATYNDFYGARRAIVTKEGDYNWGKDQWIQRDWRDVIIYEMHVRDMTAHPSSGAKKPGTYMGLTEKGIHGGLDYIKNLGVNTVELLPSQEFSNIEIPYNVDLHGRKNTWNPYERNHWGYMTSAFFAPDAYYAEKKPALQWHTWEGKSGKQVNAFKDMVKSFHKEGIAVVMDVVYNHLSEYEIGNLKEIDREYYFRLNADGSLRSDSYCGNDLRTESPMLRRLIVESIIYWMKEYHVDGFRFDLGKLIDWVTVEEIIREAKKINPYVIIVCEPWGGGYDPNGFSIRGWGAWNDQIRNGIKGENPYNGHGWIFGKWYGNNSVKRVQSYVNGTLTRDSLGLFAKKEHSVNYLESHDGLTLGDFIRLGLKEADRDQKFTDIDAAAKLTPQQTKLNKLGALFLFTAQGMTMIHEGQEFGRSKIIPDNGPAADTNKGKIDANSYDKDNEVNYINYKHAVMNKDLVDYYRGLCKLRSRYDAFRHAAYENVKFSPITGNEFALSYSINHGKDQFVCLFNANPDKEQEFTVPAGTWQILVNEKSAGIKVLGTAEGKITLKPSTGMVIKKK